MGEIAVSLESKFGERFSWDDVARFVLARESAAVKLAVEAEREAIAAYFMGLADTAHGWSVSPAHDAVERREAATRSRIYDAAAAYVRSRTPTPTTDLRAAAERALEALEDVPSLGDQLAMRDDHSEGVIRRASSAASKLRATLGK